MLHLGKFPQFAPEKLEPGFFFLEKEVPEDKRGGKSIIQVQNITFHFCKLHDNSIVKHFREKAINKELTLQISLTQKHKFIYYF